MSKEKLEKIYEPEVSEGQTGHAIKAVHPEEATNDAREARARDAQARQQESAHKSDPGPVHKFKIKYGDIVETIAVHNRHKGQAEIEARAIFNDKLPRKMRRPGPKEVTVVAL